MLEAIGKFLQDVAPAVIIMAPIIGVLAVGAVIADCLMPKIKPIQRFIDKLADRDR